MIFAVITGTIRYFVEFKPYLSGTYKNEDKSAVLTMSRDKEEYFGRLLVNNEVVKYIYYSSGSEFEFFDIANNSAKMYESIDIPFSSNIFTQKITFTYDGVEYSFKKVDSSPNAI